MQLEELRAYAARRGWIVVSEHVDHGVSGSKDKRPELDALNAKVQRGGVDVVLVWMFSRFARSVRQLVTALEEYRGLCVDFVSVSEAIDTTTAAGKLLFHVIGAVDEFFLDVLKENTRAGLASARRRGKRLGRPRVKVDVDEARRMIASGLSQRATAKALGLPLGTLQNALARAA